MRFQKIIFIFLSSNFTFITSSSPDNLRLFGELSNYFNSEWNLLSCEKDNGIIRFLLKSNKKQRLNYKTDKLDDENSFLFNENVLWDLRSCPMSRVYQMLGEIENKPITKFWIAIHTDNSTIFTSKLHQNLVHYIKKSQKILEWKKIETYVDNVREVENLTSRINDKTTRNQLKGVELKVITNAYNVQGIKMKNLDSVMERETELSPSGDQLIPINIEEDAYGLSLDVLNLMQSHLNFTVKLFMGKDRKWGTLNVSTNVWNGMVGTLVKDEADLIAANIWLRPNRTHVISFLPPIFNDIEAVFIKKMDSSIQSTL